MSRRSWLFWLAALLVVVLVGGRVLAVETAERAWAATFPGGAVLLEGRTLARQLQGFVIVFAMVWATGNLFVVYRTIGSVQMPRRLGDLEIVETVPQRVLFTLTLGSGILGGLLLSLGTGDWWRDALLASSPPHFGISDDILHHDLGYYVAVLPWQSTLQSRALWWTASAALVAGLLYIAIGSLRVTQGRVRASDHARAHLAVLLACLALALAWGAALDPATLVGGLNGIADQTALDLRVPTAAFVTAVGIATAIASLIWGWRDYPNIVLGSWSALLLALLGCHTIVPGLVRASRTSDESPLVRRRAAEERFAFGLTPIETGPPPAFSSVEAALRGGGLPLWDAARVAAVAGGATRTAVTFSASPPGWLTVPLVPPGAPRFAVETDTGLAIARALVWAGDTLNWFAPGASEFAVVSPETWPALRAKGIALQGSLRRAALAWALQGLSLTRRETDGRVLLWRRDVVDRLQRLAPFADFGEPTPAIADSALWWVSWGYVSSETFPLARALQWRDEPVRYLRAGLLGAVRAGTGETHVWLAPQADSLTAAWARSFEPLVEPHDWIPQDLLRQVPYPVEALRLAAAQLARANVPDSEQWTPRPRDPFQLAPGGSLWTGIAFEVAARPAPRFVALLAGTVGPTGPTLRLWQPPASGGGAPERLPPDLVGASETSPGQLRVWLAGTSVVTLQGLFAQASSAKPRGVAQVYLTLGPRAGHGPTVPDALHSLLTGESRGGAPVDTTLNGRWEQARRLIARGDSALTARNLERFGQVWKEIRRLLAPAPQPR